MLNNKNVTISLSVFALLLFFSYLIPFHLHPYRSYYNDAFAIFSVIVALSWLALQKPAVLRFPSAVMLPLFLIIVIAIQTSNGMLLYAIDSVFPILYLISFAIAITFGATLVAQEGGLEKLGYALSAAFVAAGLISVFFQLVQLINLNWYPYVMPLSHDLPWRPYGNLGQPNLLALLLCLSLASCWYLYLMRKVTSNVILGLALFILLGMALTQSRICWMILPMLLVLCWHQPSDSPKVSKLLLVLLLLIYFFLVTYLPDFMHHLGIALDSAKQRAGQVSVRLVLWEQGWTISKLHPWFGAGWFQFGPQQAMLASLFPPTEYSDYAHNIVLDLAATIGWPFTITIFSAALYWFYHCCVRRWSSVQVRFMTMVLLAMLLHSLVEFPLWNAYMLIPFGVIVGALSIEKLGLREVRFARSWNIILLVSSFVLMSAITWDFHRVVNGFVALAWQQAGEKQGIGSTDKPEHTLFPQYYDYFHVAKMKIYHGMPKEDIQFLERVSLRFTYPPILARLALAYADNQRPTEALQVLIAIHRLHGHDYPDIYEKWKGYAKQYPGTYGEIVKRLPPS